MSDPEEDPRVARSRTRLLAAATALLIEGGPRGVTVDAVAERSGVAKSTLYRHWSSVNELLIDVMRANVPESMQVDLDAGFEAALRRWIEQAVTTLSAPDWARILPVLLELRSQSPEMAELLAADFDDKLATVASILELGAAEGRLPAGLDARLVTETLIGPLVLAALSGDEARVAELTELAEYVVDRFLTSYRSTPTGDPR
ncbi:MAG: TetR/AcrR family transcriptional regulator [Acidimicrobiia bacterium]